MGSHCVTPIDRLLERLDGARQNGRDQYLAKCPAHDDRSPSLSIRDLGDRLLIHCFAGCDAAQVVEAAGLSLSDLFEQRDQHRPLRPKQRWDSRGLLMLLDRETRITLMAATDISQGRPLSDDDLARLRKAAVRIARVAEIVHE